MEPYFKSNDLQMFYKYLKNAKRYFEFGAGGSTYQASICKNIEKIYSIESDFSWYERVKNNISNENNRIRLIYVEMHNKSCSRGYPGEKCKTDEMLIYSDALKKSYNIDLVLIDGRFRVACALKIFDRINDKTIILFDDFLTRKQYNIILDFYKIIDSTNDKTMVALQKKNVPSPSQDFIKKYETEPF